MVKKIEKDKEKKSDEPGLRPETKNAVVGICLFVFAIILSMSAAGKAGVAGDFVFSFLSKLLGVGYFLLPVAIFMLGISFLRNIGGKSLPLPKIAGSLLFLFGGLSLMHIVFGNGGIIGKYSAWPFLKMFEVEASMIIFSAIIVTAILILFEVKLSFQPIANFWSKISNLFSKKSAGEPTLVQSDDGDEEEEYKVEEDYTSENEENQSDKD